MFVDRDIGPMVREWLEGARRTGGFLVLIGDSSVGKTRLLFEAALKVLPDFAVLAPDRGDGGPEPDDLTITVDVGSEAHPLVLAFTHGHVVSNPDQMLKWWGGQSFGRQKAGEADILVTAHFHHYVNKSGGKRRTWLQIPALDGGSGWVRNRKGDDQMGGMISVWLTPGTETGWEGLTIHN